MKKNFLNILIVAFIFALFVPCAMANEITFDGEKYALKHSNFSKENEAYEDIYLRKDDTLEKWSRRIKVIHHLTAPSALGVIQKQESFLLVTSMPYYRLTSHLGYAQDTGALSYYFIKSLIGEEKIVEYSALKVMPCKNIDGRSTGALSLEYTQVMPIKNLVPINPANDFTQALLKPDKKYFDLILNYPIPAIASQAIQSAAAASISEEPKTAE